MTPGRFFVLFIFVVGAIGTVVSGANFYIRLFYIGLLLIVLAWLMTMLSLRGLKIERRARSLRGTVGDIFDEHYEIINTSKIPKLWLEVVNETSVPNASGSRVLTLLRGKQKRSYTARTWLTNRGGFVLGPTKVTSGDPFGILESRKRSPQNHLLLFYPCYSM